MFVVGLIISVCMSFMKVMGAVKEIRKEGVKFVDGREEEMDSIVLATGYKSNVPSWLRVCMTCLFIAS